MPMYGETRDLDDQFLGEIQSSIVVEPCYLNCGTVNGPVQFARERQNPQDPNAIQVTDGATQRIGLLPREITAWLTPLIERQVVRIEGYTSASMPTCWNDPNPRVTLMVFLLPTGRDILRRPKADTQLNNLHAIVLQAHNDLPNMEDSQKMLRLSQALERISQRNLLPETRLLLALIPGVVREAQAARGLLHLAVFRDRIQDIILGDPVAVSDLTIFPLYWPEIEAPRYVSLAEATQAELASLEEVKEFGDVPKLRLTNKGRQPLLVVEGEILVGATQNYVANIPVMIPTESTLELSVGSVERRCRHYQAGMLYSINRSASRLRSDKLTSMPEDIAAPPCVAKNGVSQEQQRSTKDANILLKIDGFADGLAWDRKQLDWIGRAFEMPPDSAGVVVGLGAQVISMELFDSPITFAALGPRLLSRSTFDQRRPPLALMAVTKSVVHRLLEQIVDRARVRSVTSGLGHTLEIATASMVGSALVYASRVCHLIARIER